MVDLETNSRAGVVVFRIACVMVLAIACCAGIALAVQTAHAGGTVPISSGFSYPQNVAADGSGNIFVADYSHGAVKEIAAVAGVVSSSSTVNTIGSGLLYPTGVAVDLPVLQKAKAGYAKLQKRRIFRRSTLDAIAYSV